MYSDSFAHYGTPCKSGRYPCGSGGTEFLSSVESLRAKGLSQVDIAKAFGIKTTTLREDIALAKGERKEATRLHVVDLKERGMSVSAIAAEMHTTPRYIRGVLGADFNAKFTQLLVLIRILKDAVAKHKYVDIGDGVAERIGVPDIAFKQAIRWLKIKEGYTVHYPRVEQLGTGKQTSLKVLAPPGATFTEVNAHKTDIGVIHHTDPMSGYSMDNVRPVTNINPARVHVVYNVGGGSDKDGLMEFRPGIPELSLGTRRYAQVRVAVGGTHYLKGVAVMGKKFPKGKDIIFYTTKSPSAAGDDGLGALKPQKTDDDNPFGTAVTQKKFKGDDGKWYKSAVNVVYEEGDWHKWKRSLSSQILAKQSPRLAKEQLRIFYERMHAEYDSINNLTNPVIKQHLLHSFSDTVDRATVDLEAAALPGQTTALLIPSTSLKVGEVYAPMYENGTRIVLGRFPHGGTFELPELVVNNKNREMKRVLGSDAPDAIGISPRVAEQLAGADFDGDTVVVFPNNHGRIFTAPPVKGLSDYDPRAAYPAYPGMKLMSKKQKQIEMGKVTNLIADMTIQGASPSETARAVRHSMVVIDAEKHKLNFRQSAKDEGIRALQKKYQPEGGASTLLTRAKSPIRVPHRKDYYTIAADGSKQYTYTGEEYINKHGNVVSRTTKSRGMLEVVDANSLSSGTVIERVYGNHANKLKDLANQARLSSLEPGHYTYSGQAAQTFHKEVVSLSNKLRVAQQNRPLERRAQIVANEIMRVKIKNNPGMSSADIKKHRGRAIVIARARVGAKKQVIEITPREWDAIAAGAISPTRLKEILRDADIDKIRAYATPRASKKIPVAKSRRAMILIDAGYTVAEVARTVGLTPSQVANIKTEGVQ